MCVIFIRFWVCREDDNDGALERDDESSKLDFGEQSVVANSNRVLNTKRKYAQFHLEIGKLLSHILYLKL